MDPVLQEMMEVLALDDKPKSSFYWYVDLDFEFDACQFFDFTTGETSVEEEEAERWFNCARDYPPAPYKMKINLEKVLKSTPVEVHTTPSQKSEAVEHTNTTLDTPSDCGMNSSEGRTKDGADMFYHNLIADIEKFRAKLNPTNSVSKPSPTVMTPTDTQLAKKSNAVNMHSINSASSSKLNTPTAPETEETKRQKLQIGFLRKTSQLKHQNSFSHKTAPKTTVPQTPKLMTAERAQIRRSFRSQSKAEAKTYTFKALPLNRKIFDPPSLPSNKKSMTHSSELQKFHFKLDM